MYCKNCGSQVSDNAKFCAKCGTTTAKQQTPVAKSIIQNPTVVNNVNANAPVNIDKDLVKLFCITAGLQLLVFIFRFFAFVNLNQRASIIRRLEKYSIYEVMNNASDELFSSSIGSFVFIILFLMSIVFCIMPVIKKQINKRMRLILGKILMIYNLLVYAFVIFGTYDTIKQNKDSLGREYSYSGGITFVGWLSVIMTIVALVFMFKISKKTKEMFK